MVLPPFYNEESTFDLSSSFDKVKNFHFKRINLLNSFNEQFPKVQKVSLPEILKHIKEIPIQNLINEMSLEKIKSLPHEEWLQSPWFYLAICLALFCLICIIIKLNRKQISNRCKTTKNKWSVKFKGRENSVSKPPSESASIDEDTELYAKDWRDVSTLGPEVKLQEKKDFINNLGQHCGSDRNSRTQDPLMASTLKGDTTAWSDDKYTPSSTKSPGLYPLQELKK